MQSSFDHGLTLHLVRFALNLVPYLCGILACMHTLVGQWGFDLPRRYDVVCYLDTCPASKLKLRCVTAGCIDTAEASDHNLVWAQFTPHVRRAPLPEWKK